MRDLVSEDACPRCQKCERWRHAPDYVRDPMFLWERFPCPPPGSQKTKLLLELDWTGQMGPRDGCEALKRVASRCNVDLSSVSQSLIECELDTFSICGTTQCVIAIILACISLLFVFILVILCRYVRRHEKEPNPACAKVLTSDQSHLSTQVNRYYLHSQQVYRAGNIPDRRGLPFEARSTENGVEARLIAAIQQTPAQLYPFEEICSQCRNPSRQSTLSGRSRQGYERIYWRDRDSLQRRVPSNDSLLHRKHFERQRSTAGSTSDMSHFYEYISDTPYDTWTRRSNHSTIYFPRNSSVSFKDSPSCFVDARTSDDEHGIVHCRNIDVCFESGQDREIVPVHEFPKNTSFKEDRRSPYQSSLSDHYSCSEGCYQKPASCDGSINKQEMDQIPEVPKSARPPRPPYQDKVKMSECIKGYKYTFNPSYDEEPTNTTDTSSKPDFYLDSSSPDTPNEFIEFEMTTTNSETRPNNQTVCTNQNRNRHKPQRSASARSTSQADVTLLTEAPSIGSGYPVLRTNGSLLKGGK